jgi:hypothetical protein
MIQGILSEVKSTLGGREYSASRFRKFLARQKIDDQNITDENWKAVVEYTR